MLKFLLMLSCVFFLNSGLMGQLSVSHKPTMELDNYLEQLDATGDLNAYLLNQEGRVRENKKIVAIGLAILLGPFGAHRIYLGTEAYVPVTYTLTLGGGFFLLPLIDIIAIIATKDLSKYEFNNRVMMW